MYFLIDVLDEFEDCGFTGDGGTLEGVGEDTCCDFKADNGGGRLGVEEEGGGGVRGAFLGLPVGTGGRGALEGVGRGRGALEGEGRERDGEELGGALDGEGG